MSTAIHLAALEDVQDSLKWLREVIAGLPVEALDWVPAPGTNSIAVLASHALPSSVYWMRAGSGMEPSHRAYVQDHRNRAFEAAGLGEGDLVGLIERTERDVEATLREGKGVHLDARFTLDDAPDEPPVTGATCLVHGTSHLREHVGQSALTRELWLALATESRR